MVNQSKRGRQRNLMMQAPSVHVDEMVLILVLSAKKYWSSSKSECRPLALICP
ncbi:unnamed protein product, partial [Musa acuminata subsp. burmannicoides]